VRIDLLRVYGGCEIESLAIVYRDVHELAVVKHAAEFRFRRNLIVSDDAPNPLMGLRKLLRRQQMDYVEPGAGFENAMCFVDGPLLVGKVRKSRKSHGHIENGVLEGQHDGVGLHDVDIHKRKVPVGLTDHLPGKVDPRDGTLVADLAPEHVKKDSGTAAKIKNVHAFGDAQPINYEGKELEILRCEVQIPFLGKSVVECLMLVVHNPNKLLLGAGKSREMGGPPVIGTGETYPSHSGHPAGNRTAGLAFRFGALPDRKAVPASTGNLDFRDGITDMYPMLRTTIARLTCLVLLSQAAAADSLTVLLEQADQKLTAHQYDDAIADYLKALEWDPDNRQAAKNIALAYSQEGDLEKARGFYHKVYLLDPSDADVANNLGVIYSQLGDVDRAINYFEMAVQSDSANVRYLTNLGSELARHGQVGKALPVLRRADSLKPSDLSILNDLAASFATIGTYDSAEVYYDRCLELGGGSADFFYKLATVKDRLGKVDMAQRYYQQALVYEPDYRDCLQALGMMYMKNQRYPEATETFEHVIAVDSTFAPAWIALGATCALNGQSDRSDAILHRLFEADSALGFQMLSTYRGEKLKQKERRKR
jgi:Flp pilus assembly protein TadD